MIGLGMFTAFLGYCVMYWGIQAIQKKSQPPFINYLIPFKKS